VKGNEMDRIKELIAACRRMEKGQDCDAYRTIPIQDVKLLCDTIEQMHPVIDRLQDRLEDGYTIEFQDGKWYLFDLACEGICSGNSLRDLLINLIMVDC